MRFDLESFLREGKERRRKEAPVSAAMLYAQARFRRYDPQQGQELLVSVCSLSTSAAAKIVAIVDKAILELNVSSYNDERLEIRLTQDFEREVIFPLFKRDET